ncbi:cytochrome P450 [Thermothelomyces heterothallicus CBS 202.75]|uniref:cytochrome P450 n=1 Tax=Thermothelomyces heterothallicus CBS 202.75 TaxID=1149848 RepID=UPI003742D201
MVVLAAIFGLAGVLGSGGGGGGGGGKQPPSLWDPIPFVYNSLQFLLDNEGFMKRAQAALKKTTVARFRQGRHLVYLVSGPKNVQAVFGRSHNNIHNDDLMVRSTLPLWYRLSADDLRRFAADKTGRGRNPLPGTEDTPPENRLFLGYEHVHNEFLARAQHLAPMVEQYQRQLTQTLDGLCPSPSPATGSGKKDGNDDGVVLGVVDFCKGRVARCALHALLGPRAFEISPDLVERMWEFDDAVFPLVMGLSLGAPEWLNRRAHAAHRRYLDAVRRYLDAAWADFDWSDPASADARWEPRFGAQVTREVAKWFRDHGFTGPDTGPGAVGILAWAQNSNVIPTTAWLVMEVARDPELLRALREEVEMAFATDGATGRRTLDPQKVAALPLLASAYTETLRLRMNFNVVRNVRQSFTMAGYTIRGGSLLQVPTLVAHYDEDVWGAESHPASEFWAGRHIKYTDEPDAEGRVTRKRVFAMAGRTGSYFPYGGGNLICPGRHFAKQEIMLTIALLISRFDIEFLGWTKLDGSPSDRPPRNDPRFSGGGAAPPDRDMKIRIRPIAS